MTISIGDKLPQATLVKVTEAGPEQVDTQDYFAGKTVALFAVPGAYTPTCSAKHLPSFIDKAADLKAKGVDEIACSIPIIAWTSIMPCCRSTVTQSTPVHPMISAE